MSALLAGWNRPTELPQADPLGRIGHRGAERGTRGPQMLRLDSAPWIADTMTTRLAALITIALLAVLLTVVALAALFAGDISDRALTIVTVVLGVFTTALPVLLLLLRVETLNSKADDAKHEAAGARAEASKAARVGTEVQDFVTNGGLKKSVKEAIGQERREREISEAKRRAEQQTSQVAD